MLSGMAFGLPWSGVAELFDPMATEYCRCRPETVGVMICDNKF
jgi:hypothetical protein